MCISVTDHKMEIPHCVSHSDQESARTLILNLSINNRKTSGARMYDNQFEYIRGRREISTKRRFNCIIVDKRHLSCTTKFKFHSRNWFYFDFNLVFSGTSAKLKDL